MKWFNQSKGFGFITQENGNDIFVHYSGIETEGFKVLVEGQRVEFEVENTPKGPQAVHVIPLSGDS
ncbi:MAG: cold-shock protein [Anaerolineae bacterium]